MSRDGSQDAAGGCSGAGQGPPGSPARGSDGADGAAAPSDEALVARALALADDGAFEVLMRRHERRVRHLLRRLTRDPALAEELSQEAFLRAWRKLGSFSGTGTFQAWLAALAYNVFLRHRRRGGRHDGVRSLQDPRLAAAVDEATAMPDPAQRTVDLDRLLGAVSAGERELLILTYAAGLSATEIAHMLGTSAGTVKSRIHRAKDRIRRTFHLESP